MKKTIVFQSVSKYGKPGDFCKQLRLLLQKFLSKQGYGDANSKNLQT